MKNTADDSRVQLIYALRPHLSEERRARKPSNTARRIPISIPFGECVFCCWGVRVSAYSPIISFCINGNHKKQATEIFRCLFLPFPLDKDKIN